MRIRAAVAADVPTIYAMLRASAAEQGGLEHLCVDDASLREDGFGEAPLFHVAIAEIGDRPAGLALYFFIYSTWRTRLGLYLEDLYVTPELRRRGAARALMQHLAQVAVERGCSGMIWLVLRANPAVKLYEAIGAEALAEWMPMRLSGTELKHLAGGSDA